MLQFSTRPYLLLAITLLTGLVAAPNAARLTAGPNGTLRMDGRPWAGIGVNCFDAFLRTLRDSNNTSYDRAFHTLDSLGIPFARLAFSGFYAKDMGLYTADKEAYFRRMDQVVASARRHNIGLIPSILWNQKLASEMMAEPIDSFNNTSSATGRWAHQYTREVVERYRGEDAIWAWEIGNEYYPFGDLPGTSVYHTPTTTQAIRDHFLSISTLIRSIDPERMITSGNQAPTRNQYHRYLFRTDSVKYPNYGTTDSLSEHLKVLAMLHPDPIDMISSHVYPFGNGGGYFAEKRPSADEIAYIRSLREIGAALGKPVFLGEFGVNDQSPDPSGKPMDSAAQAREYTAMLEAITQSGVPISAVWVFDFASYDPPGQVSITNRPFWSITLSNKRAYQLEQLAEANRRLSSIRFPVTQRSFNLQVHTPANGGILLHSQTGVEQNLFVELRSVSGKLLDTRSGPLGMAGWTFDGSLLPSILMVRVRNEGSGWMAMILSKPSKR